MVILSVLDTKDKGILAELDRDCRQSNAGIARKLKLGKHVVSYRIANLEKKGVLGGYYTIIDLSKLGQQSYRVYLKLLPLMDAERKAMRDYLVGSENTWWVGEMEGKWDIGFVVWTENNYAFEKFWNAFASKFQKFVESSIVSVYLRVRSYSYAFLESHPEGRIEYVAGGNKKIKADGKDARLLQVIADNGRLGTVEIAQRTGLTPTQVKYRMKKLAKDGVIVGFRANISLDDLTFYKADFRLNTIAKKKDMLAFVLGEKWSVYADETIGFADFEYEVLCPSHQEFKDSVERFKKAFFGQIRSYDFEIYGKVLKVKYF